MVEQTENSTVKKLRFVNPELLSIHIVRTADHSVMVVFSQMNPFLSETIVTALIKTRTNK